MKISAFDFYTQAIASLDNAEAQALQALLDVPSSQDASAYAMKSTEIKGMIIAYKICKRNLTTIREKAKDDNDD